LSVVLGQTFLVPDDEDYRTFAMYLARSKSWSASERHTVEFTLTQQRELLAAVHPKDEVRRKRLTGVVLQIEAALAEADRA
jgi:hypothetical protein